LTVPTRAASIGFRIALMGGYGDRADIITVGAGGRRLGRGDAERRVVV
jgi:hypothetical protein